MKKVCVYAISKNEEKFVDRFLDSVRGADSVVVLDTGSTDRTVDRLWARGATVRVQEFQPWRFDAARNAAMAMCVGDAVLLSLDLDETIAEPDWRERILDNWGAANRGRYTYVWDHRPDGTPGRTFKYEKLHTLDFEWYLPCHEILRPRHANLEENWVQIPITIHHYPDASKPRDSYLWLLKLGVEENPDNDRLAHYYARELYYRKRWKDATVQFERHVRMPQSTWAEERCASMIYAAKCQSHLENETKAEYVVPACLQRSAVAARALAGGCSVLSRAQSFPHGLRTRKTSLANRTPYRLLPC